MMDSSSLRRIRKKSLIILVGVIPPQLVQAHVKWFSTVVNVHAPPLTPLEVIASPYFIQVGLLAVAIMTIVAVIDAQVLRRGGLFVCLATLIEQHVQALAMPLLRFGVALYFITVVLYFHKSPIILTPELKTTAIWVPVLQLATAGTLLFRRTVAIGALGMVLLYGYATSLYGWFHMLDYPVFLGIAAFVASESVYGSQKRAPMLTILRVATSVTFLWGGLEKWLYPAWTDDILEHHLHAVMMGLSPDFFVLGAGFVEVCLAFVMIFGRLASQVAAAVLLIIMSLAVPLVGWVDLIGHLPFVIVLFMLATTKNSARYDAQILNEPWRALGQTRCFVVTVAGSMWAYYLSHELAYGELHPMNWTTTLFAILFVLLILSRIALPVRNSARLHL